MQAHSCVVRFVALMFVAWSIPSSLACKCGPSLPICGLVASSSLVFAGKVTDAGETLQRFHEHLKRKLSPEDILLLEEDDDLPFAETKRIMGLVLPPEASPALQSVHTKDELEDLVGRYFPIAKDGWREVRFQVDEVFKGSVPEGNVVWSRHGHGDCGVDFEVGSTYVVYASFDEEAKRYETSICSGTRELDADSKHLAELRSTSKGKLAQVLGIVTGDGDEFRMRSLGWSDQPLKHAMTGVHLRLKSKTALHDAWTDASGRFNFSGMADGEYVLDAQTKAFRFSGLPATLKVTRGCVSQTGSVKYFV